MHSPVSVWNTAPTSAPAQRAGRYVPGSSDHPAKMLPALAAHAIRTYTRPGDLVLDPMCGIGTTLVEALHLGRNAIGVEYEPKWARLARLNAFSAMHKDGTGHGTVHCGDARDLRNLIPAEQHGRIALVVTSPPYGNSVHGQVSSSRDSGKSGVAKKHYRYSRDPNNLAHVGVGRLLVAFTEILTQCRHVLRPGGTVVITTRPWRERGELIDLPSAALAAGTAAGFVPTERNVALLAGIRDGQLVPRPSFFQMKNVRDARRRGIPQHLIVHEDVLCLVKASDASRGVPESDPSAPRAASCRTRKPRTTATFHSRTCRVEGGHAMR
ncbi:TRM11 family methyltransferase [Streptomyces sp. N35]|uniref:TRM11 family SAM-dependent methyltransferase n=1 Tax=Streptomyces sp. N35 TaxID=2795730 RepID=UPI0018F35066|nr:DNA methyltransferase [Streptomyces sp. N35]